MNKWAKMVLHSVGLMAIGFAATTLTIYSLKHNYDIPSQADISAADNISSYLSTADQRAVRLSRESAVQVVSISPVLGGMSTSSGTYVKFEDRFYILTVAHGLIGDCGGTAFVTDQGMHKCKHLWVVNNIVDYAIMEVDEIPERQAIDVVRHLPRGFQWKEDLSVMTSVYYTGFPNAMGPFTIDGSVVGYNENDFLYISSYGWAGCSGAGVFSRNGRLVAYVLALTVGQTQHGYNVSEDIIIAVPLFKINWSLLKDDNKEKNHEKEEPAESGLPDSARTDSGFGSSDR